MKSLHQSTGSGRRTNSLHPVVVSISRILRPAGLMTALAATFASTVVAGQDAGTADDAESVAQRQWREAIVNIPTPEEGCFHASYPNFIWEKVDCKTDPGRGHTEPPRPTDEEQVVGNGNDYVAGAKGLISLASGGFAKVSGVTSETGVGVPQYGDKGILGKNEYSLQLNTNSASTTSACDKRPGCKVWQQFVYSPDYVHKGEAAVYIQYWLLGWGAPCPAGWNHYGTDCWKNSAYVSAPDVPITKLGELGLLGKATAGGNDQIMLTYGKGAYSHNAKDSVLDIARVWNKAEFNVFGNTGGSRADFNKGSSITVQLVLFDGSTAAPTCLAHAGTTGESNNLNLGKCTTYGGIPHIQFTESN